MYKRHLLGKAGEINAVYFLKNRGYRVLYRNLKTPFSEIDIVAIKEDTLVFVEVKTRSSNKFGNPVEAVTPQRISRLKRAILYFSKYNSNIPKKLNIEILAVIKRGKSLEFKILPVY
mgnify:FL=1